MRSTLPSTALQNKSTQRRDAITQDTRTKKRDAWWTLTDTASRCQHLQHLSFECYACVVTQLVLTLLIYPPVLAVDNCWLKCASRPALQPIQANQSH